MSGTSKEWKQAGEKILTGGAQLAGATAATAAAAAETVEHTVKIARNAAESAGPAGNSLGEALTYGSQIAADSMGLMSRFMQAAKGIGEPLGQVIVLAANTFSNVLHSAILPVNRLLGSFNLWANRTFDRLDQYIMKPASPARAGINEVKTGENRNTDNILPALAPAPAL